MKLYLVNCGFYDMEIADGIYESHTNFFIAANSFQDARVKAKELATFQSKRMHVDGIQEINIVSGHRVFLEKDLTLSSSDTHIVSSRHRDLAPSMT